MGSIRDADVSGWKEASSGGRGGRYRCLLVDGCVKETGEKINGKVKGNVGNNGGLDLPGRTQAVDCSRSSAVLVDGWVEKT